MSANPPSLTPEEHALLCSVLSERYKRCIQTAITDVLANADVSAATRKCGKSFAELGAHGCGLTGSAPRLATEKPR